MSVHPRNHSISTRIRAFCARASRITRGRAGHEMIRVALLLMIGLVIMIPVRALAQQALPTPGGWTPSFTSGPTADNQDAVVRLDFTEPGAPRVDLSSGESGVWQDVASVTATASGGTDDSSGVASYQYAVNGGAWTAGNAYTTSTAGTTRVCFRSIDVAGNVGVATQCVLIRIGVRAVEPGSQPSNVTCTAVNRQATCTWNAATPPTGGTISGYYVLLNGDRVATVTGTTATLSDLVQDLRYRADIIAYGYDWESTPGTAYFTAHSRDATGCTVTTPGTYRVHTCLSDDTFVVTSGNPLPVDYLLVGGGGGGGGRHAGGGGGGGVLSGSFTLPAASYPVVVGAGGTAAPFGGRGGNGGSSSLHTASIVGGGGGGGYSDGGATVNGANGANGGGGAYAVGLPGGNGSAGASTVVGGFPGGVGSQQWNGGGGGGAGQAGGNASGSIGGKGGDGKASAISGTTTYYGGGGGGAGNDNVDANGGAGGLGGGGRGTGAYNPTRGVNGTNGLGGGGGGSRDQAGTTGGSGVVIVRYQRVQNLPPGVTTLPDYSASYVKEGETVTVTNGTWDAAISSYGYQWQRSTTAGDTWVNITGATSASYVVTSADVGQQLRARVRAFGTYGATDAFARALRPPANLALPSIEGETRAIAEAQPASVSCVPDAGAALCTWSAATAPAGYDLTGYRVYLNGNRVTATSGTSHRVRPLTNGVIYKLEVATYGSDWESTRASTTAQAATLPAGALAAYTSEGAAPTGWLVADGSAVSRTAYADLFQAIGTAYGEGDGETTFNLPDLRGRVPVGMDADQAEFDTRGETGGAKTHALTTAEMPQHDHSSNHTHAATNTANGGNHGHTVYFLRQQVYVDDYNYTSEISTGDNSWARWAEFWSSWAGDHTDTVDLPSHSSTTDAVGAGTAHENLQPYRVARYMIAADPARATLRAGFLIPTTDTAVPTGFALADGISGTPDVRGRVVVGQDAAQADFDLLGETGGSITASLTPANLPSHNHAETHDHPSWASGGGGNHQHYISYHQQAAGWDDRNNTSETSMGDAGRIAYPRKWLDANGAHSHTWDLPSQSFTTGSTGGGTPHDNLQPYRAVTYLAVTGTGAAPAPGMVFPSAASSTAARWTSAPLAGRVPVGVDAGQAAFDTLGETGGAKARALTVSQMASHGHPWTHDHAAATTAGVGNHQHYFDYSEQLQGLDDSNMSTNFGRGDWGPQDNYGKWTTANGDHAHAITPSAMTGTTAPAGAVAPEAHNELQPYIALPMISPSASADAPPSVEVLPDYNGSVAGAGTSLQAFAGTWIGSPTSYDYQWQISDDRGATWSDIADATRLQYTVTDGDVGPAKRVRVVVRATNAGGTTTAYGRAVQTTTTFRPGETVRALHGVWRHSVRDWTYQWQRALNEEGPYSAIGAATNRTYGLTTSDSRKWVRVAVTAGNADGVSSAASLPIRIDAFYRIVGGSSAWGKTNVRVRIVESLSLPGINYQYRTAVAHAPGQEPRPVADVLADLNAATPVAANEVTISDEAETWVQFRPIDGNGDPVDDWGPDFSAGVDEGNAMAVARIDRTNPTITVAGGSLEWVGANDRDAAITATGEDNLSGGMEFEYRYSSNAGNTWSSPPIFGARYSPGCETTWVQFRAHDAAGNTTGWEPDFSGTLPDNAVMRRDCIAPSLPTISGGSLEWRTTDALPFVASGATDAQAGGVTYEWRTTSIGASGWGEVQTPEPSNEFSVSAEAENWVQVRARDAVGNVTQWVPLFTSEANDSNSIGVGRIDRTGPTQPSVTLSSGASGVWQNPPGCSVTVSAAGGTDVLSGIAGYEYRINAGEWIDGTPTAAITREGVNVVDYRAVDRAGNPGAIRKVEVKLDCTGPPAPTISLSEGAINVWQNASSVTATATSTDDGIGTDVTSYQYSTNPAAISNPGGVTWTAGRTSPAFTAEAAHTICFRVRDMFGTYSAVSCGEVRLDRTTPSVPTIAGGGSGTVLSPDLIASGAVDDRAGIAPGGAGYQFQVSTDGAHSWGKTFTGDTYPGGESETEPVTADAPPERTETFVRFRAVDRAGNASDWTGVSQMTRAAGPAGYWRFEEETGAALADSSGNGRTATVNSGTSAAFPGGAMGGGTYLQFDGTGSAVGTSYTQDGVVNYSVAAWVKTGAALAPIAQARGANGKSLTLSIGRSGAADGAVWFGLDSTAGTVMLGTQSGYNDNKWHYVVGVFSGAAGQPANVGQIKVYVDGQLAAASGIAGVKSYTSGTPTSAPYSGDGGLQIGRHEAWGVTANAAIDEVSVWEKALSAGQVTTLYGSRGVGRVFWTTSIAPPIPFVSGGSIAWRSVNSVEVSASVSDTIPADQISFEFRTAQVPLAPSTPPTQGNVEWTGVQSGQSVVLSGEGETWVQFRTVNTIGETSDWGCDFSGGVTLDSSACVVRIDRSNPVAPTVTGGSSVWRPADVIYFNASGASDAVSGLDTPGYEYRKAEFDENQGDRDNPPWSEATRETWVSVSREGETWVQFRSRDLAGNVSSWSPPMNVGDESASAPGYARIDRTAPTLPTVSGGDLTCQNIATVNIAASGSSDFGSGLAGYRYRISSDGGDTWSDPVSGGTAPVTSEGTTIVQFQAVDNANNATAWVPATATPSSTACIDRTPPTTGTVTGGSLEWRNVPSITLTASGATDVGSGIGRYEYRSSRDGGTSWSPVQTGNEANISDEGCTLVQFRAVDRVGLNSVWFPPHATGAPVPSATACIDRTPPTPPASLSNVGDQWQLVPSVTVAASGGGDTLSGIARYEHQISTDGGTTWKAPPAGATDSLATGQSLTVTQENDYRVRFRVVDNVGLSSSWLVGRVRMDNIPPVLANATFQGVNGSQIYVVRGTDVYYDASVAGAVRISLGDGSDGAFPGPPTTNWTAGTGFAYNNTSFNGATLSWSEGAAGMIQEQLVATAESGLKSNTVPGFRMLPLGAGPMVELSSPSSQGDAYMQEADITGGIPLTWSASSNAPGLAEGSVLIRRREAAPTAGTATDPARCPSVPGPAEVMTEASWDGRWGSWETIATSGAAAAGQTQLNQETGDPSTFDDDGANIPDTETSRCFVWQIIARDEIDRPASFTTNRLLVVRPTPATALPSVDGTATLGAVYAASGLTLDTQSPLNSAETLNQINAGLFDVFFPENTATTSRRIDLARGAPLTVRDQATRQLRQVLSGAETDDPATLSGDEQQMIFGAAAGGGRLRTGQKLRLPNFAKAAGTPARTDMGSWELAGGPTAPAALAGGGSFEGNLVVTGPLTLKPGARLQVRGGLVIQGALTVPLGSSIAVTKPVSPAWRFPGLVSTGAMGINGRARVEGLVWAPRAQVGRSAYLGVVGSALFGPMGATESETDSFVQLGASIIQWDKRVLALRGVSTAADIGSVAIAGVSTVTATGTPNDTRIDEVTSLPNEDGTAEDPITIQISRPAPAATQTVTFVALRESTNELVPFEGATCRLDDRAPIPCRPDAAFPTNRARGQATFTNIRPGTHTVVVTIRTGETQVTGTGEIDGPTPANATVDVSAPSMPMVRGGSLAWSRENVTITASGAVDPDNPGAPVAYEFRTSTDRGETWSSPDAGATHTVTGEGETWVQFRARDDAGNATRWAPLVPGSNIALIDRTAPSAPEVTGGSSQWRASSSVTVTASGSSDALSGLRNYQYRTSTDNGSTWSKAETGSQALVVREGKTLVQFRTADRAGNASDWSPEPGTPAAMVMIDRNAPTLPSVSGGSARWQSVGQVRIFAAGSTDAGAGLANPGYEYQVSTNGGRDWSSPGTGDSVVVADEGETTVQFRAKDALGNVTAWVPATGSSAVAGSARAMIDRTPPTPPLVSGGGSSCTSQMVVISGYGATDATSGVERTQHRVSTDGRATWSEPMSGDTFMTNTAGQVSVQFRAIDGAGNVSDWAPQSFDTRAEACVTGAPTVAVSGGSDAWQDGPVTISATADQAGTLQYRTSADAGATWSSPAVGTSVTIRVPGETRVQFRLIDDQSREWAWSPADSQATGASRALIRAQAPTRTTPDGWVTDGAVSAMARSGSAVYVGGDFTMIAPRTGPGSVVSTATGGASLQLPMITGGASVVHAVASDGAGGWFIGGDFARVGGAPRGNIAHVTAAGEVDASFAPAVNGPVRAIVRVGSTIYIGGAFTDVAGTARAGIAALTTQGQVVAGFAPSLGDGAIVNALAAKTAAPSHLIVGGEFDGAQGRNLASIALDGSGSGALLTGARPDGAVSALAVDDGTLYVGGAFSAIYGQARARLAAVDVAALTGTVKGWGPAGGVDSVVRAIAVAGTTVYIGGDFSTVGGQPRAHLASLPSARLATGAVAPGGWRPEPSGRVRALAVTASAVFAGGDFLRVNGASGPVRPRLAAFSPFSSSPLPWNPSALAPVNALALTTTADSVYVGGAFLGLNAQQRAGAAALDPVTNQILLWNPNVLGGPVRAIARGPQGVYLGGDFTSVAGQSRERLAMVDALSGALQPGWSADANGSVRALTVSTEGLYVGGAFTAIEGASQAGLARLNTTTGARDAAFSPAVVGGAVYSLGLRGPMLLLGGDFTQVNGIARGGVAEIARQGHALGAADPAGFGVTPRPVRAVAYGPVGYFVAGECANPAQLECYALALVDSGGARIPTAPPTPAAQVSALAGYGAFALVGGSFDAIDGAPRPGLGLVDPTSGTQVAWAPSAPGPARDARAVLFDSSEGRIWSAGTSASGGYIDRY